MLSNTGKATWIRIAAVGLIVLIAAGIYIYKNQTHPEEGAQIEQQAESDKLPTLLELSSTTCPPCREMVPILKELQKEYEGRVTIKVIDINKYPEEAEKYSIRVIPTQILLDADGSEVGRHEGFIPKEDLIKAFEQVGVQ